MLQKLLALLRREEGQDLIEYALIVTALSIGIIVVITAAGIPGAFSGWGAAVVDWVTV